MPTQWISRCTSKFNQKSNANEQNWSIFISQKYYRMDRYSTNFSSWTFFFCWFSKVYYFFYNSCSIREGIPMRLFTIAAVPFQDSNSLNPCSRILCSIGNKVPVERGNWTFPYSKFHAILAKKITLRIFMII